MADEMEAEPGIAQEGEMGAGIGQSDMAVGIADQPSDRRLVAVEELGGEEGAEILLETEIEEPVERMNAGRSGELGDRASFETTIGGSASIVFYSTFIG